MLQLNDDDSYCFRVNRDEIYISDMIKKCDDFKRMLDSFESPPLIDSDYRIYEDEETPNLVEQYNYYRDRRKEDEKLDRFI